MWIFNRIDQDYRRESNCPKRKERMQCSNEHVVGQHSCKGRDDIKRRIEYDTPFILPKFEYKPVNNIKRKVKHWCIHCVSSAFPNVARTKHSIEHDMTFAMSFTNKFGDVDQESMQITGKSFYELLTCYCDQK